MKKLTRFLAVLLTAAMTFSLAACGGSGNSDNSGSSSDTIKLGILGPYTGDVAQYGISVYNGAELYINGINEDGGINGKKIEIIKYDEKGDATEAVNAYTRMAEEGVVGIIGDVTSTPTIAVAQESVNDNMPMITASATAPDVVSYGNNFFRACCTDPFQGQKMANFASEKLNAKTAAIIYNTGDDYSTGCANAFEEECKNLGINVLNKEGYAAGDVDFNAQLTSIMTSGAEVIFCPNYYQDNGKIVTQARALGIKSTFLGADGWDGIIGGKEDYASAEDLKNCYFCCSFTTSSDSEAVQNFVKAYTDAYGNAPSNFEALGYDAAMIMCTAIAKAEEAGVSAGTDEYKQAVIDAMQNGEFDGVTGNTTFDENGDPIKTAVICTLSEEGSVFYENY